MAGENDTGNTAGRRLRCEAYIYARGHNGLRRPHARLQPRALRRTLRRGERHEWPHLPRAAGGRHAVRGRRPARLAGLGHVVQIHQARVFRRHHHLHRHDHQRGREEPRPCGGRVRQPARREGDGGAPDRTPAGRGGYTRIAGDGGRGGRDERPARPCVNRKRGRPTASRAP